jgi:predicted dehydrogenase
MNMKPLRIGIIGCGYWGPNLIRNFVELPGSEVVAVSDLREERLAHIKSRFPSVKVTQDYETLFHMGLDGVVVATPPATHYQLARECLLHGLSVMVEKPLALNSGDCIDLIRLARLKGLALEVGHTFEYNPAVRTLRRIVQSGELGQVYYISAVRANLGLFQRDLDVMWDLAPHDLSMILFVLEQEPISVGATGGSYVIPRVHDIVQNSQVDHCGKPQDGGLRRRRADGEDQDLRQRRGHAAVYRHVGRVPPELPVR